MSLTIFWIRLCSASLGNVISDIFTSFLKFFPIFSVISSLMTHLFCSVSQFQLGVVSNFVMRGQVICSLLALWPFGGSEQHNAHITVIRYIKAAHPPEKSSNFVAVFSHFFPNNWIQPGIRQDTVNPLNKKVFRKLWANNILGDIRRN